MCEHGNEFKTGDRVTWPTRLVKDNSVAYWNEGVVSSMRSKFGVVVSVKLHLYPDGTRKAAAGGVATVHVDLLTKIP